MEALCVSVCGWIHFISSSAPMIVPLPESSSLHSLLVHTKQDNFEFFSSPFCGELFPPGCSLALYPLKRLWHYIGFCATLFCVCNNVEQLCSWFIQFESEAQKWRCGAQGTTWEHYSRTKNDSFECHSNVEEARVVCIAHCASDAIEQLHLLETLFILFLPFSSSSSACTVSIHRQWWKLNIACDFTMTDDSVQRTSADPLCTSNYLMHPAKSPSRITYAQHETAVASNCFSIAILHRVDNKEFSWKALCQWNPYH